MAYLQQPTLLSTTPIEYVSMGRRRAVSWSVLSDAVNGPFHTPLHTVGAFRLISPTNGDRDGTQWRSSDDGAVEYDSDNSVYMVGISSGAVYASFAIGN